MFSSGDMVSVAICSPYPLIREGLVKVLAREEFFRVLVAPLQFERVIAWTQETKPKILLYDMRSSSREGLALLATLKDYQSRTRTIILLEDFSEEFAVRAVQLGAYGCLPATASPEDLIKALRAILAGELWLSRRFFAQVLSRASRPPDHSLRNGRLTPRQSQIVELVSCGMTNRNIAEKLCITEATVRAHMNDIFRKLGLHHRVQLAMHFAQGDRAAIPGRVRFSN